QRPRTPPHPTTVPTRRSSDLEWSSDLLTPAERVLFSRLAVFSSGWTLEACEAVCAGGTVEEWLVLDLLTALVDKSLIITDYVDRSEEHTSELQSRFELVCGFL